MATTRTKCAGSRHYWMYTARGVLKCVLCGVRNRKKIDKRAK